jgi:hypothetical protein
MLRRHEINAPTGFERSVPFQAVQFYTAQVRLHIRARLSGAVNTMRLALSLRCCSGWMRCTVTATCTGAFHSLAL